MPTLGQAATQTPWAQPAPLPSPPVLEHWLLEKPLTVALAALALGLVVAWILRSRGRERAWKVVGIGSLVVAAGLAALGGLVRTDREAVEARAETLLDAVERGDAAAAGEVLAQDVVFDAGDGRSASGTAGGDRGFILEAVGGFPQHFSLDARRVRHPVAVDAPGAARSQVFARASADGVPAISWWLLSWRKEPDGVWRVRMIELLSLNGRRPAEIAEQVRSRAR